MSDITVIGLGAMGSALARAFTRAGHDVTVWNRTTSRMKPLVELGATAAASLAESITASPVIVICINNYATTRNLIGIAEIAHRLAGRTVVQLSTGTPREARDGAAWIQAQGAACIDGAILPYPEMIGTERAQILFAGPEPAYRRCEPLLSCLGGDLRYLGGNIAAAAVLDMALLTHELCEAIGVLHAARVCQSEGVGTGILAAMFPDASLAKALALRIDEGAFDQPRATIAVWESALQRIQSQADAAGINGEVPGFISSLFRRAIAAGHGEQDIAALIKVLRATPS